MVQMVQRLSATLPTPSEQSTADIVNHLKTELITSQCLLDLLILTITVVLALELLNSAVYYLPRLRLSAAVPVRGKHLDNFSLKDKAFITFNKCLTGIFVYCYFGYLWSVRKMPSDEHEQLDEWHSHNHTHEHEHTLGNHHHCCGGGNGIWALNELSLVNTLLPVPLLFITYDFFYTLLHLTLHIKGIYAYVHKHHHHQKAPSRANVDAVNVHPLEFFLGEFNHVLALHIVVRGVPLIGYHGVDVSWLGAATFIGLGGVLAGLNHTRHDVVVRIPPFSSSLDGDEKPKKGYTVFDSKHHDVHHRIPQSNYGQYTVIWDRIFRTFREYDERDRINPAAQLDPLTGKTKEKKKD